MLVFLWLSVRSVCIWAETAAQQMCWFVSNRSDLQIGLACWPSKKFYVCHRQIFLSADMLGRFVSQICRRQIGRCERRLSHTVARQNWQVVERFIKRLHYPGLTYHASDIVDRMCWNCWRNVSSLGFPIGKSTCVRSSRSKTTLLCSRCICDCQMTSRLMPISSVSGTAVLRFALCHRHVVIWKSTSYLFSICPSCLRFPA